MTSGKYIYKDLSDSKVSSQEQRADGDEDWADEEEDCGQSDGFVRDFGRTPFKLWGRTNALYSQIMDNATSQSAIYTTLTFGEFT